MNNRAFIFILIIVLIVLVYVNRYYLKYASFGAYAAALPNEDMNSEKLNSLHPSIRVRAKQFINDVNKQLGYNMQVTSGARSTEKQAYLYATQNNAARPGYSLHEYGLAFDVINSNPPLGLGTSKAAWQPVVEIAKKHGLRWGGEDFAGNYDPVHFYQDFGIPRPELMEKVNNKQLTMGYVNI